MKTEIIISTEGTVKHYWNNEGVNQELFDRLTTELMPSRGSAKTLNGELIRAVNRLSYEYCNNGNWNACEKTEGEYEECKECSGTGYVTDEDGDEEICRCCYGDGVVFEYVEYNISDFYGKFLGLIEEFVIFDEKDSELLSNIKDIILLNSDTGTDYFSNKNMSAYDRLIDYTLRYVVNNEDKALPEWYLAD